MRTVNDEVVVADEPLTWVGEHDVELLKARAAANPRRRIRICAHPDVDDPLHEMLIVHARGVYVRPHRHPSKSESMHVIEGAADVVFFDDEGRITQRVPVGAPASGSAFYYRLRDPVYHSLVVRSEYFVFHEVTNGPFRRDDTEFAPWAPEENDVTGAASFLRELAAAAAQTR